MTFGEHVIKFHAELKPNWKLPSHIDLIYPFDNAETKDVFDLFFTKYFSDDHERTFLFGINPGRFGAGVTGIPFTDPKILEQVCEIKNNFNKRNELSAIFIYEMIEALGGPEVFYSNFYITSICPLGFTSKGKNINYYDDKELQKSVTPKIIENIETQIQFGANRKVAYSIGQGKNLKFFQKINQERKFFDQIIPVPHPRWVMQYRLKSKEIYIDEYVTKLSEHISD